MNTPLLNSLGVFISNNVTLITYTLFATAFIAAILAIVYGRNVVSVACLQFAATLFFLLGFMSGLKLTLFTVSFLCLVIAFGDGFARYGKGYRAIAVLLVFLHIVACYMVFTGKIARFQVMKNVSELEVLSLVLFFIAFRTWANGNPVLAAGLTVVSCSVSVGYLCLALPDATLILSYFTALGIFAVFPRNGILGFFKTTQAEVDASTQAVTRVLKNKTTQASKPAFVGNIASKVAKKQQKTTVSSVAPKKQRQRNSDAFHQQVLLDQLNEELFLVNQDIESFYGDDISYYQD